VPGKVVIRRGKVTGHVKPSALMAEPLAETVYFLLTLLGATFLGALAASGATAMSTIARRGARVPAGAFLPLNWAAKRRLDASRLGVRRSRFVAG
jgi:hypothetical protein